MKSEGVGLIVHALVCKMSDLCGPDPPTLRTDRQTDGRHAISIKTALCTKVHRAVKTLVSRTVVDYLVESEARAVAGQAKWLYVEGS